MLTMILMCRSRNDCCCHISYPSHPFLLHNTHRQQTGLCIPSLTCPTSVCIHIMFPIYLWLVRRGHAKEPRSISWLCPLLLLSQCRDNVTGLHVSRESCLIASLAPCPQHMQCLSTVVSTRCGGLPGSNIVSGGSRAAEASLCQECPVSSCQVVGGSRERGACAGRQRVSWPVSGGLAGQTGATVSDTCLGSGSDTALVILTERPIAQSVLRHQPITDGNSQLTSI